MMARMPRIPCVASAAPHQPDEQQDGDRDAQQPQQDISHLKLHSPTNPSAFTVGKRFRGTRSPNANRACLFPECRPNRNFRHQFWVQRHMRIDLFALAAKVLYILAAAVLLALSLTLIVGAVWAMLRTLISADASPITESLRSIGMVVIGIAVFDVSKYLIEEEVMRSRELRSSREARQSLTKFMTIIVIATSLEGLVSVFEVDAERIERLLYPVMLLGTSVLALVGLSIFQCLSRTSESTPQAAAEEPRRGCPSRLRATACGRSLTLLDQDSVTCS
jgi:hypothetical protein